VKAIAVFCRIWNQSAIREDNPIFRFAACANIDKRRAKNSKRKKSDLVAELRKLRNRELAIGSLTPHRY